MSRYQRRCREKLQEGKREEGAACSACKGGRGRRVLLWNWIQNSIRNGTYQEISSSPIKDWHNKSRAAFVNSTCDGVGQGGHSYSANILCTIYM